MLERISIDLTNYCSKECDFCYNKSSKNGITEWKPEEVTSFLKDCAKHGVKAISIGGGEPFEYKGIYKLISKLMPHVFVSVTTNGMPLTIYDNFVKLTKNKPDKIHITIHDPANETEVNRTIEMLFFFGNIGIKTGANVLVSADKIAETKKLTELLFKYKYLPEQIIYVPRKFTKIPTPQQVAEAALNKTFQSASCLLDCKINERFCSISWDKQVGWCSYGEGKTKLGDLTYQGLMQSLGKIKFKTCKK